MDMCRRAEFRGGEGMVIVEPKCGGRVVIRAGIRSFVERGWVRVQNAITEKRGNGTRI